MDYLFIKKKYIKKLPQIIIKLHDTSRENHNKYTGVSLPGMAAKSNKNKKGKLFKEYCVADELSSSCFLICPLFVLYLSSFGKSSKKKWKLFTIQFETFWKFSSEMSWTFYNFFVDLWVDFWSGFHQLSPWNMITLQNYESVEFNFKCFSKLSSEMSW